MRKPMLVVAMLAMVLATTIPALAQLTQEDSSEFTLVPADRYNAARCPFPVEDAPSTLCTVDEDGFITTPDGAKVPYSELSDEPLYDTYTGNLVRFVDGEPVIVEYGQLPPPVVPDAWPDEASFLQYETARCMDPLADHRGCGTWINPDGSLSQA